MAFRIPEFPTRSSYIQYLKSNGQNNIQVFQVKSLVSRSSMLDLEKPATTICRKGFYIKHFYFGQNPICKRRSATVAKSTGVQLQVCNAQSCINHYTSSTTPYFVMLYTFSQRMSITICFGVALSQHQHITTVQKTHAVKETMHNRFSYLLEGHLLEHLQSRSDSGVL